MLGIKLLGGVMIILSSFFVGRTLCSYERNRLLESEAFLNLIRHIKSEIFCYKTPLPKIISSYTDKSLSSCGFLSSFDISWNDALTSSWDKLHIDGETKELLLAFGKELGGSYKDEQINSCDYYANKLSEKIEKIRVELPQKEKMYRSLAVVTGIFTVIILM